MVALITVRPERAVQMKHAMQGFIRDAVIPMTREQALALSSALSSAPGQDAPAVPDVFVIDADLDGAPAVCS